MNKFEKVVNENIAVLNQYVPIVKRVHGGDHPEFIEVAEVYDKLVAKLDQQVELDSEFMQLRKITSNYEVPNDTCESYEAVYNMLEKLDKAYFE